MKSLNRKQKIIVSITGIFIVLLALVGLTYAYFLTQITGNGNPKSISVTTANLRLVYADEDDQYVIGEDEIIEPNTTFEPKTFTVTNTGNGKVDEYAVILDNVSITYANTTDKVTEGDVTTLGSTTEGKDNDFTLVITCKNQDDEPCNGYNAELLETSGILLTNSIEVDEVHTYTATLTYNDTGHNQSADMNKRYNGRFNIIDTKDTIDIGGTVSNYDEGDYVQTNSTKRVSVIYPDGTYKVMGLEAGQHRIRVFDKTGTTTKLDKTINIVKGSTAGVSGTTITITPESRTAIIDIANNNINIDKTVLTQDKLASDPYAEGTLAYNILENAKAAKNGTSFSQPITQIGRASGDNERVLSTIKDGDNDSYYFRGLVYDNYVEFNNMCWRVLRIEGDGSVKLMLSKQDRCSTITDSDRSTAFIGWSGYGYKISDSGFYDTGMKVADYQNSTNGMKVKLENWYNASFKDNNVKNKIKLDTWCLGGDINYKYDFYKDNTAWYYSAHENIGNITNMECKFDEETVSSKIGTINIHEFVLAGGTWLSDLVYSHYLKENAKDNWYWTLSRYQFRGMDRMYVINLSKWDDEPINQDFSVRPSITLKSGVFITDGTGLKGDPYIIG